jgi:hypothetical protein
LACEPDAFGRDGFVIACLAAAFFGLVARLALAAAAVGAAPAAEVLAAEGDGGAAAMAAGPIDPALESTMLPDDCAEALVESLPPSPNSPWMNGLAMHS